MLDLTYIREHPDEVKKALAKLNTDAPIDKILELDRRRRELLQEVEALRAERGCIWASIIYCLDGFAHLASAYCLQGTSDLSDIFHTPDAEPNFAKCCHNSIPGPESLC